MSKFIRIFCFLLLISCSTQNDQLPNFLALRGEWQRIDNEDDQAISKELWRLMKDGSLSGLGLTIENGDTIFVERLKILQDGVEVYYQADVSHNPEPVKFKWNQQMPNWQFENPDHDFPKVIKYVLEGDTLKVEIAGDGKKIPFTFIRI